MYQAPEQFAALNKANLETAARFASIAFGGAERLFETQLKATKAAMADGMDNAKKAFLADWMAVLYRQRTARELRWQLDVDPLDV